MNLDDLDTLVIDADPAIHTPIPLATSAEADWTYMQITRGRHRDAHKYRHIPLPLKVGGVVAAALAIVLGLLIPSPGGPQAAAAAVLETAAASVKSQNDHLAPGQFQYEDIQSLYQLSLYQPGGTGVVVKRVTAQFTETVQLWINAAGTGSVERTESALRFSSSADRERWNSNPVGQQIFRSLASDSGERQSEQAVANVSDLPTDPGQLASVIANGQLGSNIDLIPSGPNSTFERSAALLVGPEAGMSPSLASALFQVLANQHGSRLLGNVTDHSGRRGEGIVLGSSTSESTSEIVVDPDSGSLLEAAFVPSPVTLPAGEGQTCLPSASGALACSQQSVQAVLAPAWTDLVASGIVDSNSATLPPFGSATPSVSGVTKSAAKRSVES
jgi:hypothetical protein